MGERDSAFIDFTEAAYDLEVDYVDWLPKRIRAGAPALDKGLGVFALTAFRPLEPGAVRIDQTHALAGAGDFDRGVAELLARNGGELLWPISRPGIPKTLSEVAAAHNPAAFPLVMQHFDFAKDAVALSAFDPNGHGAYLIMALPKVTSLTPKARERWQMLAAHFGAGYRLRRAVEESAPDELESTGLPHGAEVVIDPFNFDVTDATGEAKTKPALRALREAAQRVDRARGALRDEDPDEALEMWQALVRGRWSTVDYFDSDGRRYVLGIPNAPDIQDPRGLNEREMQVVTYAAQGMTNKMIGYHLGISKGRVSGVLGIAMKKLNVHTRAQLIKTLIDFGAITGPE